MSAPPPNTVDPIVVPSTMFANPSAITDEVAAVSVTPGPRPAYLQPLYLPGYGTKITRIGGDYGTPTAIGGTWGKVALHHYSKDQPWDHGQTMIYIEQRQGYDYSPTPANSPTKMILDNSSYQPIIGNKYSTNNNALLNEANEFRWRPQYAGQAIGWNNGTQILKVFNLVNQQVLFTAHIPHACRKGSTDSVVKPFIQGEGLGLLSEGVISNDGRYLVLCTFWKAPQTSGYVDQFCVIDIEAGIAGIHYANAASSDPGVGPWNSIPCTTYALGGVNAMPYITRDLGDIDFCSISPLGNYVVVKYSSNDRPEYARSFSVNPSTLVCTPKTFIAGDTPILSGYGDSTIVDPRSAVDYKGWMSCASHADFGISSDPSLGVNTEVYVGGMRIYNNDVTNCASATVASSGHYIAQDMATGKHIHVSMGTGQLGGASEAEDQHASCRSYMTPEWLLASYSHHATNKFGQLGGEMVLWELLTNGDGAPVRCGCTFTDDEDTGALGGNSKYLAEAHAVASPGCEKIMFASNWKYGNPSGPVGDYKSYILEPGMVGTSASGYEERVTRPRVYDPPPTYVLNE